MNNYIVTYEYSDETIYSIEIQAKNKNDAKKFIEVKFKHCKVLEVEEINEKEV